MIMQPPIMFMTSLRPDNYDQLEQFATVLQLAAAGAGVTKHYPLQVEFLDRTTGPLEGRLATYQSLDKRAASGAFSSLEFGIGTTRNSAQLEKFAEFDSLRFFVFPGCPLGAGGLDAAIFNLGKKKDSPEFIFGGSTPTELRVLQTGHQKAVIKAFPANTVGNVRDMLLQLDFERHTRVIPTGKVTSELAPEYFDLSFGNITVCAGIGSEYSENLENETFPSLESKLTDLIGNSIRRFEAPVE